MRDDDIKVLSISKWENKPFEALFSDVIPSETVNLYKGDTDNTGHGR
jgi:hypothetical protein